MRAKHFTPPPELYHNAGENKHPKTPPRTGVLYAKIFGQLLGKAIPPAIIQQATGIAERSQQRIIASKQCRTTHNSRLKTRGRNRALTKEDTYAIAVYLDNPNLNQDSKSAPWQTIVQEAPNCKDLPIVPTWRIGR